MQSPSAELHDIPDPQPLLPGIEVPAWFWIVVSATMGALLIAGLYLALRRKPALSPPSLSCFAEACSSLSALRDSLSGRPLAEVATETSFVLRHYLVGTLQEPALYETHEEFLTRDDALDKLPQGARKRLAPLLSQLAQCKYGPSRQDDQAARELVDNSLEVLQGLESTRERQVA